MSEKRFRWLVVTTIVLGAGIVIALGAYWELSRGHTSSRPGDGEAAKRRANSTGARPTRRRPAQDQYVGSAACTSCHEEVAAKYAMHTMNHSMARVPDNQGVEKVEQFELRPGGRCVYKVEKTDQGWFHSELVLDADGEPIYEQQVPIHLAIGSGIRGRTYVTNRGGLLFQSPVSWFSQAGTWDLSPGYTADDPRRFDRRITTECLFCHSGSVQEVPGSKKRFGEEILIETTIGCERCHGPGKRHIDYHNSDDSRGDDPIVQPALLDADRQNAICFQCHLVGAARVPRYGMSMWDFQPGDLLQDVFISFVHPVQKSAEVIEAVSQVEQMMESRCFQASGRKLSCTTCHDPHTIEPKETRPAWFRSRCLQCHQEESCGVQIEQRKKTHPDDGCIKCHMPTISETDVAHTATTDHRIVRQPGQPSKATDWTTQFGLSFFDGAEKTIPNWEFKRTLGLAIEFDLDVKYRLSRDHEMERLLRSSLEAVPDDAPVLMALGRAALRRNSMKRAREYFSRGLKSHPEHEGFLGGMGNVHYQMSQEKESLEFLNRLLRINPWDASTFAMKGDVLRQLGRSDDAIAAGERALELNPRLPNGRKWLIETYHAAGRSAEASRHLTILRKLEQAQPAVKK